MNKPTNLPKSNLVKKQVRSEERAYYDENNVRHLLKLKIRFDDECNNGHNTFSMTSEHYRWGRLESCGCQHELVAKVFPEFAKYIKWHLTSTDGPLHYIANTLYWVKQGKYAFACSTAVWPDADAEDLTEAKLLARLPDLMREFKKDMKELGFSY